MLGGGELAHLLVLLLHLADLSELLKLLLILHLLLWTGVLHVLSQNCSLHLKLLPLFLQPFLLKVGEEHVGLLPLAVQEPTDGSLNLDGRQVLRCHWPGPRLLDDSL